jgi:predicted dehydrogenase
MRIVLVGLGSIGKRHLRNILTLWPSASLLIVSASKRQLSDAELSGCQQVGLEQAVLANPDFAFIASPASMHLQHAAVFRQAGIPVLLEKPFSHQLTLAEQFKNASAPDYLCSLGYCLRYLPSAQIVRDLLAEQRIGSIYSVHASVGQHLSQWRRETDYQQSVSARSELGGGVLLELSHEFDYLVWLFSPLTVRFCQLNRSELQLDVEERADLVMTGQDGLVCYLHLDFVQSVPQRSCMIIGQNGRIEWDLLGNSVYLTTTTGRELIYHQPDWDKNQMYLFMLQDFVKSVHLKTQAPIPMQAGIEVLRLIEQSKQLASRGN